MSLSSARSVTAAVRPPRAVFVDFPLGHTAGKRGDIALQRHIMLEALAALEEVDEPGTIRDLPYRWAKTDEWKSRVMRPQPASGEHQDDRTPRSSEPQYQYPEDREAAEGPAA